MCSFQCNVHKPNCIKAFKTHSHDKLKLACVDVISTVANCWRQKKTCFYPRQLFGIGKFTFPWIFPSTSVYEVSFSRVFYLPLSKKEDPVSKVKLCENVSRENTRLATLVCRWILFRKLFTLLHRSQSIKCTSGPASHQSSLSFWPTLLVSSAIRSGVTAITTRSGTTPITTRSRSTTSTTRSGSTTSTTYSGSSASTTRSGSSAITITFCISYFSYPGPARCSATSTISSFLFRSRSSVLAKRWVKSFKERLNKCVI